MSVDFRKAEIIFGFNPFGKLQKPNEIVSPAFAVFGRLCDNTVEFGRRPPKILPVSHSDPVVVGQPYLESNGIFLLLAGDFPGIQKFEHFGNFFEGQTPGEIVNGRSAFIRRTDFP